MNIYYTLYSYAMYLIFFHTYVSLFYFALKRNKWLLISGTAVYVIYIYGLLFDTLCFMLINLYFASKLLENLDLLCLQHVLLNAVFFIGLFSMHGSVCLCEICIFR